MPAQRWELIVGAGVWLFVAVAIFASADPVLDIRSREGLGFCLFASIGLLFCYAELLRCSVRADVDVVSRVVTVQRRNWLWQQVRNKYSLGRFGRVRSIFAMRGKYPKVRVELVERENACTLTLAEYTPESYFSDFEPQAAARLRKNVSVFTGLMDSGFEGVKRPFPKSKPDFLG
ncbi:MAG: hypothetical protein JNJ95_06585 [Dechloromonas sp.]|nr:hypothetical protein [Dechloromonas sp.]